jgi:hypothetical protein
MADPVAQLRDCRRMVDDLIAERDRYKDALAHIAEGNISPAMRFAELVLDGDSTIAAHRKVVSDG